METSEGRPDAVALLHGAVWRAASLLSRVAFLALIVPRTSPGDFGVFFSYSSLGLLFSRVASLGAIDNLPIKIGGEPAAMRRAFVDLLPFLGLAVCSIVLAALINGILAATIAVGLSMASGLMLAGAVRSVSPAWFERWLNLHPICFLGLALTLGSDISARELLLGQAIAIVASQVVLVNQALRLSSSNDRKPLVTWPCRAQRLLSGGGTRMVSDVLNAACTRAFAIGPVLLGGWALSDSLALALALGEAAWTVGMILVHRNFSYYCSAGADLRHSLRSASVLLTVMGVCGAAAAVVISLCRGVPMVERLEPDTLMAAIGLFAGITALWELRYFDLAAGEKLQPWVTGQLFFLAAAATAPVLFGEVTAVWLIAAVTTVASVWLIVSRSLVVRAQ
jgi:hypothetical protein